MRNVSLSKPYIADSAINNAIRVLKSGWLTQGRYVAEFEDAIKKKTSSKYAVAINSATSGIHLSLLALGIKDGDEVIVPAFTWVATANAVELCNAKPVFVDIDPDTLNTNVERILEKITQATKAIIIVHLFGKPFDVLALKNKVPSNIFIIEDAACALGAEIKQQPCGTMGIMGIFSFHPRKSITTGEGGMIVTNDHDLYLRIKMLRNHGQDCESHLSSPSSMFDCPIVGFNNRMTDLQAAIGLAQMHQLDDIIKYRKELVGMYEKILSDNELLLLPSETRFEKHSWQAYVVLLKCHNRRDYVMTQLENKGIETRPGTHAVHMLSYYKKKYNMQNSDYKNSYTAFQASISLPLHNHMTKDDVKYVSTNLLEAINAL